MRSAGVLMPITSLPSPWGIGTLGRSAREFLDFLAESGQTYWQLLPIGPTGYGDSPYQPFSSYAGNPYLIDLDDLAKVGLLLPEEYQGIQWSTNPARVDYGLLYQKRFQVLKKAVDRLWANNKQAVQCFCDKESYWLEDYSLFMSLKSYFGGRPWKEWPEELRHRERESMSQAKAEMESDILFWKGVQFLFFEQWERLKSLAEAKGISIIGDIPIYVAKTVRMYGHIRISSRWTLICILPGWLVAHRMAFLQMASCGAILFLIGSRCGQMAITGGCTVFLSSLGFMMCFVSIISGALMLTMLFRLLLRQPKKVHGKLGLGWTFSVQWRR